MTSISPMHTMHAIPFDQVVITDGFWKHWQDLNRNVTIHAVFDRFQETGRFDALRCAWKEGEKNRPHIFWDSDVAKWIEAVAYLLEQGPEPELEAAVDRMIADVAANQWPDGYINSYYTTCEPGNRFTRRGDHELYCAGHWMEAAVAYFHATGKRRLLDCVCRFADLIERVFVIEKTAGFTTPGHEEIELALVKLWQATNEERYLNLSRFFVDQRGRDPKELDLYLQSHQPVREQRTAVGHAVRASYLYSAMADLARIDGDAALRTACEALFENITQRRMYLTGGTGSTANGEAFTVDYDLPNRTAYAETCAAIALALFAGRMQLLENRAEYADTVERILYNGMLAGISLDGDSFFYENPLAIDPVLNQSKTERHPITQRVKVFNCSCCPPNLTRFLASLGGFLYTADEETIYCHQFMQSEAHFSFRGQTVSLTQTTAYPLDGSVYIRYHGPKARLAVRVPAWCRAAYAKPLENGYDVFTVSDGDEIALMFDMQPRLVYPNPMVRADAGRAAVMRGPVVYCMEGVDNGAGLWNVRLADDPAFAEMPDDRFGCIVTAKAFRPKCTEPLYSGKQPEEEAFTARLIPYHAFANRGETEMAVWIRHN